MALAEELITSSQAAVILGKSARTVARLAQLGDLPVAAQLAAGNGVYLFRRADVEKIAAERAKTHADSQASA